MKAQNHLKWGKLAMCAALAGIVLSPGPAVAWSKPDLVAVLDSEQTVPLQPNDATGIAMFKFTGNRKKLKYKIYVVDLDLDGFVTQDDPGDDVTQIHIHAGLEGSTGGHILNVYKLPRQDDKNLEIKPFAGRVRGVWDDRDENLAGAPSVGLSDAVGVLCSGLAYINVHSVNHPTGAIRGQILPESKVCDNLAGD
jgi:hypothetical protein